MIQTILTRIPHNKHYLTRYIKFIEKCGDNITGEKHHICPKAQDMFPAFASFIDNPWNCKVLSPRQHFIAHWLLYKAYPEYSSQAVAFSLMSAKVGRKGKDYEKAKLIHGQKVTESNKKRKGLRMSEDQKNQIANTLLGRKLTEEHKKNISESLKGIKFGPPSEEHKTNLAKSKMTKLVQTPLGIFDTYHEAAAFYQINFNTMKNVFRCLDNVPTKASLARLQINSTERKTYREWGFNLIDK